jgi:hypothetical protein
MWVIVGIFEKKRVFTAEIAERAIRIVNRSRNLQVVREVWHMNQMCRDMPSLCFSIHTHAENDRRRQNQKEYASILSARGFFPRHLCVPAVNSPPVHFATTQMLR